jgi:hypothetical protein
MTKHNYWTYFTHNIKKYVSFSLVELTHLFWVVLATAFVFTFNKWGTVRFDFERGLANLFIAFVFIAIFYVGQTWVKKAIAATRGYDTYYEWSPSGILISIMIAFLTLGFPLLLLGHTTIKQNDRRRLGGFNFALNQHDLIKITALSYLFNYFIIILILGPIYIVTQSVFVDMLIKINLALIFYPLLPVPKNDGLYLFFASRNIYFLLLAFVIIISLLILWAKVYSFVIALILALVFWRIVVASFKLD